MFALSDIAPSMSLRFVDMLVAARIDTAIFGVHSGSGEDARVPGRVCCGVLAFWRVVCFVVL